MTWMRSPWYCCSIWYSWLWTAASRTDSCCGCSRWTPSVVCPLLGMRVAHPGSRRNILWDAIHALAASNLLPIAGHVDTWIRVKQQFFARCAKPVPHVLECLRNRNAPLLCVYLKHQVDFGRFHASSGHHLPMASNSCGMQSRGSFWPQSASSIAVDSWWLSWFRAENAASGCQLPVPAWSPRDNPSWIEIWTDPRSKIWTDSRSYLLYNSGSCDMTNLLYNTCVI